MPSCEDFAFEIMNKINYLKIVAGKFMAPVRFAICGLSFMHMALAAGASEPPSFDGGKSEWHGFDRYDFIMDDQTLAVTPFKAPPGEGDGIKDPPKGTHRCVIVVPKELAPGNPWSWRGCYWNHMPQAEIGLLHQGFCIAYISAGEKFRPGKQWDAWYAFLTEHGLSPKPVFVGMSRGGEFSYMWATTHPDKVSGIYADNPGGNWDVLMGIAALATNDVPLLHVCGSLDPILGKFTFPIENMYQQFGGRISVMIKEGAAHHPHSLPDPKPIVDFMMQSVYETNSPLPAFVGTNKFTKTSFYSPENFYRDFPKDGTYITCRGPMFTPCYDRYQFTINSVKGAGLTVIVPKVAAPGNPWVFRADFVGRDEVVDQALLAKGFYIVTGPVPYDNGPLPAEWDATYKYLADYGFSKKPVMEGDGAAAGEAYAWAMANPDKVSCIYGENPIMHSNLSKIPLLGSLGLLAKTGVPLISVCGSLDPGLKDNTLAIEKRYKKLGGKIKVIIQKNEGHYPLAPTDPKPVVDFIVKATQ
jgi:hypothetical protein